MHGALGPAAGNCAPRVATAARARGYPHRGPWARGTSDAASEGNGLGQSRPTVWGAHLGRADQEGGWSGSPTLTFTRRRVMPACRTGGTVISMRAASTTLVRAVAAIIQPSSVVSGGPGAQARPQAPAEGGQGTAGQGVSCPAAQE